MSRVHIGLPLQVTDLTLWAVANPQVELRGRWRNYLGSAHWDGTDFEDMIANFRDLLDGFLVFLEVTDADWGDNTVIVGVLGDILDTELRTILSELMSPALVRVGETASRALDVLSLIPIFTRKETAMQWLNTQIHAMLGANEELVHSINWRGDGAGNGVDPTIAEGGSALQAFSNTVRDAWATVMLTPQLLNKIYVGCKYDYVKTSLVQLGSAGGSSAQQGGNVTSNFAANLVGEGQFALPYEVACVATLRTVGQQSGGASHGRENRGRVYFGGLAQVVMGADGLFAPAQVNIFASNLGAFFDSVHGATDQHAAVVSKAHLLSHPITMIQMGVVPDSQRRRRRSQDENRSAIWSGQLDTVQVGS